MKVTVSKYLNARINKASTDSPCKTYRSPGECIEIDDVLIGTEIDGNSIWYHCKDDGCYYWSGGIVEVEFEIVNTLTETDLNFVINNILNEKSTCFKKLVEKYKGLGIGYKNNDPNQPLSLIIFVEKKLGLQELSKYSIPPFLFFKGCKITTDVRPIANAITHQYMGGNKVANLNPDNLHSPILIGASISNKNDVGSYGTRTIKVAFEDKICLLSCFHVLLGSKINSSQSFYFDQNDAKENAIFPSPGVNKKYGKFYEKEIIKGEISNYYDYALLDLKNGYEIDNEMYNKTITDFVDLEDIYNIKNTLVRSVGATSFEQSGKIVAYKSQISLKCCGHERTYLDVIVTEKISEGGDSGAPVITNDNKLLGYVVGGNGTDATFILPYYRLFQTKNIKIK